MKWVVGLSALAGVSSAACEQIVTVGRAPDASRPSDASPRDAQDEGREGGPDGPSCSAPPVDLCDPVRNTGCLDALATRCSPNLMSDTLAGYCAFIGRIPDGGLGCLNTVATESCPPTTTCVGGQCRSMCFCDADCEEGSCCSEPLGEQGFFLCAPC